MMNHVLAWQTILGLVIGFALVWRAGRCQHPWRFELLGIALLGAALAMGGFAAATLLIQEHVGFAILRVWFDAIYLVLAPLTLVVGLLALRRRERTHGALCVLAAIGALGAAWWATRVEPFRLQISHHVVHSEKVGDVPIVIAILADIQTDHIGPYERHVFESLDALEPDLVLLPGDYLQCANAEDFAREQLALADLFNTLEHSPRLGILGVDGDVDRAATSLLGTDVQALEDELVRFETDRLQVIGLRTPSSRRPLPERFVDAIRDFDGLTIVCGHAPEFMVPAVEGDFREEVVMVAGHTHGGQVVIPGFGPPLTLAKVPRWLAAGGLHRAGSAHLLVSRGIGLERGHAPRIRFFCPPEIVVLSVCAPTAAR